MKMKLLFALALATITASSFAADIPQNVLDLHNKACPEFSEAGNEWWQRESYDLGAGTQLIVLGCEMYAYNSMEKAYLVDAYSTNQVAVVEVTTGGEITATTNLMGAGYDAETKTLGTFQKGRGIGDCGSSAEYKFDERSSRFVLTLAREKQECDGEDTEWPVIYKK